MICAKKVEVQMLRKFYSVKIEKAGLCERIISASLIIRAEFRSSWSGILIFRKSSFPLKGSSVYYFYKCNKALGKFDHRSNLLGLRTTLYSTLLCHGSSLMCRSLLDPHSSIHCLCIAYRQGTQLLRKEKSFSWIYCSQPLLFYLL